MLSGAGPTYRVQNTLVTRPEVVMLQSDLPHLAQFVGQKNLPLVRIALGPQAPGGLPHACLFLPSQHPGLCASSETRSPLWGLGSRADSSPCASCWGHRAPRGSPPPHTVVGWRRETWGSCGKSVWPSSCHPRSPASPTHRRPSLSCATSLSVDSSARGQPGSCGNGVRSEEPLMWGAS